jgi:hypothetical protein
MCRRSDIEKRIMDNVVVQYLGFEIDGKPSPCHIWQGSDSGSGRGGGYPRMSLDGQTVAVHIVRFTNHHGYVPGKKQIDHLCNNRMCVNQDHLEMVTHKENQRRRVKRKQELKNSCAETPICSTMSSCDIKVFPIQPGHLVHSGDPLTLMKTDTGT